MSLIEFVEQIKHRSNLFQKVLTAATQFLAAHPDTEDYLISRVSQNNQTNFEFGYFPQDDELEDFYSLVDRDVLLGLGLIYERKIYTAENCLKSDQGTLRDHNLICPYRDIYGNIIGLMGRTMLSEEERKSKKLQKYKYTQFTKALQVFGLQQNKVSIQQSNAVFLVEGQIDCMTCIEYGIDNIVALGGSSLSKYQFNLLRRYTDRFFLLLDGDEEGKKAQKKIYNKYSSKCNMVSVELWDRYAESKDIDSLLRKSDVNKEVISYLKGLYG